jgi:hypothetical protein
VSPDIKQIRARHAADIRSFVNVRTVDLPDFLVERIVNAMQAQMPEGMAVVKARSRVINLRASRELAASIGRPSAFWASQVGVRDRDGLSPQSVAWATWMVLDSALHMSRRLGIPWPKDVAGRTHAYAEAKGNLAVVGWVTDGADFRVDFPAISLAGVEWVEGTGGRFAVSKKYRLPADGPVTDPGNH